ncbi:MAG: hypothetical protein WC608_02450 [Parcubacteria group bacterium]
MKILADGLLRTAGMMSSCIYLHNKKPEDKQKKLIIRARLKENVRFDEFLDAFPLEMNTGEEIKRFAASLKKEAIDEETINLFFGGDPHIEYAIRECEENLLQGDLRSLFIVFHVELPIEITETEGSLKGVYKNDPVEIFFDNLISLTEEFAIFRNMAVKKGSRVLVHYGSIVATDIDKKTEKRILKIQRENEVFAKALKDVKRMDCRRLAEIVQKIYAAKV